MRLAAGRGSKSPLFGTFTACKDLLRQEPQRATTRAELRKLPAVASGGVIFTTIQKFFPDDEEDKHPRLTDRRNVVVIADEAHRGQYNFVANLGKEGDFEYGFAQHVRDALPNAAFVGFKGTPVERYLPDESRCRKCGELPLWKQVWPAGRGGSAGSRRVAW